MVVVLELKRLGLIMKFKLIRQVLRSNQGKDMNELVCNEKKHVQTEFKV